jgi:hypothetical protein
VRFAALTLRIASQLVCIVVIFVIYSVRKLLDTPFQICCVAMVPAV